MTTVGGGDFSPPLRGGWLRDQEKSRSILSSRRRGGDKLPKEICCGIGSPPRPPHRGGFATFYRGRGLPSSKRRGKLSSSMDSKTHGHPPYRAKRPRYVVFHLPVRFNLDTMTFM